MSIKQTLFIAALWALFLAPATCLTGALDHFCPCETEIVCGHELDCSTDPCNILALTKSDIRAEHNTPADTEVALELPGCAQIDPETHPEFSLLLINILEFPNLQEPDSCLPLLC